MHEATEAISASSLADVESSRQRWTPENVLWLIGRVWIYVILTFVAYWLLIGWAGNLLLDQCSKNDLGARDSLECEQWRHDW